MNLVESQKVSIVSVSFLPSFIESIVIKEAWAAPLFVKQTYLFNI